ncbi:MAG: endo alpha-1,4 polygalactosaminidase [Proteobacteria bacterium]|nr:endo alpha-1,4 polygalactosaminidase [Pseudomonadota bacterium]
MRTLWILGLVACSQPMDCETGEVLEAGTCTPYSPEAPVEATVWTPEVGTTWQWQITGTVDTSLDVAMYDVDLFDLTDDVADALSDRTLICYFSAGSWEEWRPDADDFPVKAVGRQLDGWPDERWLDIRDPGVREVLAARLDMAVEKECDGVEPDNITAFNNNTGFGINATEQLDFNRWLADEAHARDLSIGLKNDLDQLEDLQPWFDWALNEECLSYDECEVYDTWLASGMAVFHTEYVDDWADADALASTACSAVPTGFSTLVKTWDLGAEFLACP